jgi:hypothetical protein
VDLTSDMLKTRPIRRSKGPEDTGLMRLDFPVGSVAPSGLYDVRGGICWPRLTSDGQQVIGAALLCGKQKSTGIVYVFEEAEFAVVDWVTAPDRSVEPYPALSPLLGLAWTAYGSRTFYWHQDYETGRKYLRQIYRSELIEPKPVLPEVPWQEPAAALAAVFLADGTGLLRNREGGILHQAMSFYAANRQLEPLPALHALAVALAGYERRPE